MAFYGVEGCKGAAQHHADRHGCDIHRGLELAASGVHYIFCLLSWPVFI